MRNWAVHSPAPRSQLALAAIGGKSVHRRRRRPIAAGRGARGLPFQSIFVANSTPDSIQAGARVGPTFHCGDQPWKLCYPAPRPGPAPEPSRPGDDDYYGRHPAAAGRERPAASPIIRVPQRPALFRAARGETGAAGGLVVTLSTSSSRASPSRNNGHRPVRGPEKCRFRQPAPYLIHGHAIGLAPRRGRQMQPNEIRSP